MVRNVKIVHCPIKCKIVLEQAEELRKLMRSYFEVYEGFTIQRDLF